jgi:hypothetical protein
MKVELDADRFSLVAAVQWGFAATFSDRQMHPAQRRQIDSKTGLKAVESFS